MKPACLSQEDHKTPTEIFSNQTWVGLLLPVANGLITAGYVTVNKESGLILTREDIISYTGYTVLLGYTVNTFSEMVAKK